MSLITSKARTCFFFFCLLLISFILISSDEQTTARLRRSSSSSYPYILPVTIAFATAVVVILAVRTTVVAWITVLVLLAFAGKRRRVLVLEGRKITGDVAMYLVKVVVRERGLVAVAFATILSSLAVLWS